MDPSISSAENFFSFSRSNNLLIFLSIIQWKTGWNKDTFFKKEVMYELRGLFI